MIEEYDGSGSVYYIREPGGRLIAGIHGQSPRYYHFDALGSTRLLTDAVGTVTDTYAYDAWGNLMAHTGMTAQPYQFVGKLGYHTHWQDAHLTLLQLGVRFYNPQAGRFEQRGVSSYEDNNYIYATNNPLEWLEYDGLRPVRPKDPRFKQPKPHGPGGVIPYYFCIQRTIREAYALVAKHFPRNPRGTSRGGPGDAFRHCVWACLVRRNCGPKAYNSAVIDHEVNKAWWARGHWDDTFSPMDLANDERGRKCAVASKQSCDKCCWSQFSNGQLYILPEDCWE